VYQGQYSGFRARHHGAVPRGVLPDRLINFAQNHDQIGNRPGGDRLVTTIPLEASRLVAATLLLSPGVPLLFMGEEYGETAPFPYFVDHHDPGLLQAVREGRAAEFSALAESGQPYDPGDPQSFLAAKLDRSLRQEGQHRKLLDLYTDLINIRHQHPALGSSALNGTMARNHEGLLTIERAHPVEDAVLYLNFTDQPKVVEPPVASAEDGWSRLLASHSEPGRTIEPWGFVVWQRPRPLKEQV